MRGPKDAKLEVVDLEFLTRLDPPTTLREIKESHLFDDWSLVRQSRLSTMAAPKAFAEWMRKKHRKTKILLVSRRGAGSRPAQRHRCSSWQVGNLPHGRRDQ